MRISVRRDDPGYHPMAINGGFQILLDGEDVTNICHTADEEEGRVYGYALNKDGDKYIDPDTGFAAEHVMLGEVEVVKMYNGVSTNA